MKILQVLDSYPPDLNGGAYFTHRLSKQLQQMAQEVLVICPSRSRVSHYDTYDGVCLFRVKSYPILLYKNFRICSPLGIFKLIENTVMDFKPDVIHLQGRFILGDICMRIATKFNLPVVATNHFMPENFFHYTRLPKFTYKVFSKIAYSWVYGMFRNADIWTTPTLTAAKLLKKHGFLKEIHSLSCGIDLQRFYPGNSSYSLPAPLKAHPLILYAGRLDKEKNLTVIIDALAELRKTLSCKLIIVGDGAERAYLKHYVANKQLTDHVHFCGYLSDEEYPGIFSQVDCFVHAGTAELQSIVTLEALASGLPVVLARAVALPELVIHGGNGFLFEPGCSLEAASYLLKILTNKNLKAAMGAESFRIGKSHDISLTGEKFIALYKQAINQRSKSSTQ